MKKNLIYVDNIIEYPSITNKKVSRFGYRWCHLWIDGDIDILHKFASVIGLKKAWFQNHKLLPHYDLTNAKRILAIKNGAVPMSVKQYLFS